MPLQWDGGRRATNERKLLSVSFDIYFWLLFPFDTEHTQTPKNHYMKCSNCLISCQLWTFTKLLQFPEGFLELIRCFSFLFWFRLQLYWLCTPSPAHSPRCTKLLGHGVEANAKAQCYQSSQTKYKWKCRYSHRWRFESSNTPGCRASKKRRTTDTIRCLFIIWDFGCPIRSTIIP